MRRKKEKHVGLWLIGCHQHQSLLTAIKELQGESGMIFFILLFSFSSLEIIDEGNNLIPFDMEGKLVNIKLQG